jgi:hypothetical protein
MLSQENSYMKKRLWLSSQYSEELWVKFGFVSMVNSLFRPNLNLQSILAALPQPKALQMKKALHLRNAFLIWCKFSVTPDLHILILFINQLVLLEIGFVLRTQYIRIDFHPMHFRHIDAFCL